MKKRDTPFILFIILIATLSTLNCKKLEIVELTKIKSGEVSDIGLNSASISSTFIDASANVTEFGHCWNTSANPTIDNFKDATNSSAGKGIFTNQLTDLESNTTYYVRPFAVDNGEIIYGIQVSFKTLIIPLTLNSPAGGSVWDMASKQSITWTEDITGNVTLVLRKNGEFIIDIITGVLADDVQFDWFVPMQLLAGLDYSIEIVSEDDGNIFHESDFFTINAQKTGTVNDIDGNTYPTIKIGEQWWMAKNLMTTRYANDSVLVDGTGAGDITGDYLTRYYFAYDNNEDNVPVYGRLYTWSAVMNYSITEGVQGICPNGWHVPTNLEWKELLIELGMSSSDTSGIGFIGIDEGGKLKGTGTEYWQSPNTGATNASGFNALPCGLRYNSGTFSFLNTGSDNYSSTLFESDNVWDYSLFNEKEQLYRGHAYRAIGLAVRCIQGQGAATEFPNELYIYGAATDAGWTAANSIYMNPVGTKQFEVYVHLTTDAGGIKFIGNQDENNLWGMDPNNPGYLSFSSNQTEIPAPAEEGFYLVEVDFNSMIYTLTKTDWGIIGSAVEDWNNDLDMTYVPPYTWTIDITLHDGEFKFRANDAWIIDMGDNDTDGSLELGGANIPVTTGGYTVNMTLHPNDGYTYSVVDNNSVPYIRLTIPEDHWEMGTTHDITWEDNINENINIYLTSGGVWERDIALDISSDGNYSWTIPTDLSEREDYQIQIISTVNFVVTDGSNFFEISAATGASGTITDFDNNTYNTIKIGLQWWMADNVKSIHYADGTELLDGSAAGDLTDDETSKYYFAPENLETNVAVYGRLYTHPAVMNGEPGSDNNPSGIQGICPIGWHVPSDAEWNELESFIGIPQSELDLWDLRGTIEGGKLKDTIQWYSPNTGATDEYQFRALPAHSRGSDGSFGNTGWAAYFWNCLYYRVIFHDSGKIGRFGHIKSTGMSVRCVKD